jgi:hypothetical protein
MELFGFLGAMVFAAFGGYAYGKSVGEARGAAIASAEMSALHRRFRLVPKVADESFADSTY